MPRFACTITAARQLADEVNTRTILFMLDVASRDEAVGKGWRLARRLYPREDGWEIAGVLACEDDFVIEDVNPDGTLRPAMAPTEAR